MVAIPFKILIAFTGRTEENYKHSQSECPCPVTIRTKYLVNTKLRPYARGRSSSDGASVNTFHRKEEH
jgi:hypothetical protein